VKPADVRFRLSSLFFVGLLTWGAYAFLVYFGQPSHRAALLSAQATSEIARACEGRSELCSGLLSIVPSVLQTFRRGAPFLWYVLPSFVLYGVFLGVTFHRHRVLRFQARLRPWHILLLFLASSWLIFTAVSFSHVERGGRSVPLRRVIEPHPGVYPEESPKSLRLLRRNFAALKDRGCLAPEPDVQPDARGYWLRASCVQQSFLTRVLPQIVFLFFVVLVLGTLGRAILAGLRVGAPTLLTEATLSVGLGACAAIVFLWLAGVLGLYTAWLGWGGMTATLVLGYRHLGYWVRVFAAHRWEVRRSWHSLTLLCAWLLLSYLALNFLVVIRPFPTGWDALGSYLNRPKLLVSYGRFIHSMPSFQWEYLTSLGFLLFGSESVFGATAAMMMNWLAGPFALLVILATSQLLLGPGTGVVAALLYYSLPLVGQFSFADMKTDNAAFALQASGLMCVLYALFRARDVGAPGGQPWRWYVLAGTFCAFAFGTKATAIMGLMALAGLLFGAQAHWTAFVGVAFFSACVFEGWGVLEVERIAQRAMAGTRLSPGTFQIVFLLLGSLCFVPSLVRRRKDLLRAVRSAALVAVAFLACVAPWILHNNLLAGIGPPRLLLTAPRTMVPVLDLGVERDFAARGRIVRQLRGDLRVDSDLCRRTGREEELGRYWGFGKGWQHYLELPWRAVMNLDVAGYYVTTSPALLLFPLLLLLPFFWVPDGRWLRWVFLSTMYLLLQWILLANGVPWYGIVILLGLVLGLEVLLARAPNGASRWLAGGFVGLALVGSLGMRLERFEAQENVFEYSIGKTDATTMRVRALPHYDEIVKTVMMRHARLPERPYLYRVGTFIPYFLPRNLEVVGVTDQDLDVFSCLHQEGDNALTLRRLQALGFNSIVFDTRTATIETDVNGSLHRKVRAFVDFLNDRSLGLRVVVNDPGAGIAFVLLP